MAFPEIKPTDAFQPFAKDDPFIEVLAEVGATLQDAKIPYGIFGGVASTALGRPRTTRDIDVFLRPERADAALSALSQQGYQTDRLDKQWIYKAHKGDIVVDVIFATRYGIYFDEPMQSRVRTAEFEGVAIRTIAPEDLLIIKAVACDEASPKHWYDALGLIINNELDWEYIVQRSTRAQHRVLSLLLYAQSIDYLVPDHVVHSMALRLAEGQKSGSFLGNRGTRGESGSLGNGHVRK